MRVLAFPTMNDFGNHRRAKVMAEPGYALGAPAGTARHAEGFALVVGENLADDATLDELVRIAFPRPVETRFLQIEWVDTYGKNFFAMDSLDIVCDGRNEWRHHRV